MLTNVLAAALRRDPHGNVIVYDYNPDGTLLSVFDPADPGRAISLD